MAFRWALRTTRHGDQASQPCGCDLGVTEVQPGTNPLGEDGPSTLWTYLVGGWTNPFEKYDRHIGNHPLPVGVNIKDMNETTSWFYLRSIPSGPQGCHAIVTHEGFDWLGFPDPKNADNVILVVTAVWGGSSNLYHEFTAIRHVGRYSIHGAFGYDFTWFIPPEFTNVWLAGKFPPWMIYLLLKMVIFNNCHLSFGVGKSWKSFPSIDPKHQFRGSIVVFFFGGGVCIWLKFMVNDGKCM